MARLGGLALLLALLHPAAAQQRLAAQDAAALAADDACLAGASDCALSALQHLRSGRSEQGEMEQGGAVPDAPAAAAAKTPAAVAPKTPAAADALVQAKQKDKRQTPDELKKEAEAATAAAIDQAKDYASKSIGQYRSLANAALDGIPVEAKGAVKKAVKKANGAIDAASAKAEDAIADVADKVNYLADFLNVSLPDIASISGNVETLKSVLKAEVKQAETLANLAAQSADNEAKAEIKEAAAELNNTAQEALDKVEEATKAAAEKVSEELGSELGDLPADVQKSLEKVVSETAKVTATEGEEKSAAHRNSAPLAIGLLVALLTAALA